MTTDDKNRGRDLYLAVLEKYKDTIRGICFKYLHNDNVLCREMIQDVNIALLSRINSFPRTASGYAQKRWIVSLTKQVIANSLRHRRTTFSDLDGGLPDISVTMDGTGEIYEVIRTSLTLEEQWLAHNLISGYSVNELADAFGLTKSAMRKRIDILRKKLSKALYGNQDYP